MIHLRACLKKDLTRLYDLDQACFSSGIAYSADELKYFLSHPMCLCWAADESDGGISQLAGFLILERTSRHGALEGHIVTLDVDPSMRRRGIGRLLMQRAETQMRKEGATLLRLEVAVNNGAALQFYQNAGFSPVGRISNYYPGGLDARTMEKNI